MNEVAWSNKRKQNDYGNNARFYGSIHTYLYTTHNITHTTTRNTATTAAETPSRVMASFLLCKISGRK